MKLEEDDSTNDEGKAGLMSSKDRELLSKFLLGVTYPPPSAGPTTTSLARGPRRVSSSSTFLETTTRPSASPTFAGIATDKVFDRRSVTPIGRARKKSAKLRFIADGTEDSS